MKVEGDARVLLDAVGKGPGDPEIVQMIALLGTTFSASTDEDVDTEYWSFHAHGAEVELVDRHVRSLHIYVAPVVEEPEYAQNPRGTSYFPPLSAWATRREIEAAYGGPDFADDDYIVYRAGAGRVVRFDLDDESRTGMVWFMTDEFYR